MPDNRITLEVVVHTGREHARVNFDTGSGKIFVEGSLYPADLSVIEKIVTVLKESHRYRQESSGE